MAQNLGGRLASVAVRCRRDGGEFVDSTLDCVRAEALSAAVSDREFRSYATFRTLTPTIWRAATSNATSPRRPSPAAKASWQRRSDFTPHASAATSTWYICGVEIWQLRSGSVAQ
jgi:hypothetical protein